MTLILPSTYGFSYFDSFDFVGLLAFLIVIMYMMLYMFREEKMDVKVTKEVKEKLLPKLTSNILKVNEVLKNFIGFNVYPQSLTKIFHEDLSISLISELNVRIPSFARMFRSYVDSLKNFDSISESRDVDFNVLRESANKIIDEGNRLLSEISKINSMKKLPARQGAFSSLRR